ncbi:TonB-linked outer membrane protein, SusC/RagA family [Catalinimonas alkaloidigena]|uniref:TonB-linked outer membrane protein, SusC/RagA family n=1 Tax=Catalinimonas alkaloidigena TaxID=1075417 RepID=A0A1G9RJ41_9BACT|nr:TonB-dependent receptor [Catalinimonas alkaloidigena]SDM22455.1 TonB-linked outer membrane protein, SusC/RagA family [Catalinimonas alkaloidigena]
MMQLRRYLSLLAMGFWLLSTPAGAQQIASARVLVPSQGDQPKETLMPLNEVLQRLEQQFNVHFLYRLDVVLHKKNTSAVMNHELDLETQLDKVLKPHQLSYRKLSKNNYAIVEREAIELKRPTGFRETATPLRPIPHLLAMVTASVQPQARQVTGRVTDASGDGVPGVNIVERGTTNGTITDVEGRFTLTVEDNAVLVFSAVGYLQQEIEIGNRSVLDVTMEEDVKALEEVVVVGYGEQSRAKVTGAVSSVSAKELDALPVASPDAALQGRAAGVIVTNQGSPGTSPAVRIRGIGTVGNTSPLYVIDGMPAGGLNNINPNDIESVTVLKDAATAAIYGNRAANGVIMITTKKGSSGKPRVNVDSYIGTQKAWRQLDLLNVPQYIDYARDLQAESGDVPARIADDAAFANSPFANIQTDWQDAMFRNALIQDHNVSVSGGTENARYNVGGGYFQQEGIMLGTGFKRYSFRANSSYTLSKRFSAGQTLTLSYTDRQVEPFSGGRSQIEHIIKSVPYIPIYDPTRLGGFRATDRIDGSDPENPVLNAMLRKNNAMNYKMLGTAFVEVNIFNGFKYKFLLGLDFNLFSSNQYAPSFNAGDFSVSTQATLQEDRNIFFSPLISNQFTYNRSFGQHTIDALAVIEQQTYKTQNMQARGINSTSNDLQVINSATNPNATTGLYESVLQSYVGRVNYDYAGKYLFSASIRRDATSRFSPEYRVGYFPAVSAGYRISEEAFMDGVPFLSDLKLRGSYGEVGNQNIPDYRFQATLDPNFFVNFNGVGQSGSAVRALANKDIQWETTKMTNIGLDLGLLDNRITLTAEWFQNVNDNMLLEVPIPPSQGYDVAPIANVGSVRNRGVELTAGYNNTTGGLTWSVNGNISFINNELTTLGIGKSIFGPGFENDAVTYTEEGQPIQYFYGWVVDRLYQSQEEINADNALDGDASTPYQNSVTAPGDIRFKDLNSDGVINAEDRTNIGHYLPDFTYGLNATLNWRGFDLTLFLQGVSGNEILNTNRYDLEGMTRLFNAGTAVLDRWTPTNTDTDIPRAIATDPNRNSRVSTRFIEDGSYFRVKNLSIGYTIPAATLQSLGNGFISSLRVYLSSSNLLTFTKYTGYDPEVGKFNQDSGNTDLNYGVDYGQFPQARTFFGGIQIGF